MHCSQGVSQFAALIRNADRRSRSFLFEFCRLFGALLVFATFCVCGGLIRVALSRFVQDLATSSHWMTPCAKGTCCPDSRLLTFVSCCVSGEA
jgi:hypothetical protein